MKTIYKTTLILLLLLGFNCSTTDDSSNLENFIENEKFFAKVNDVNFISGDPWVGANYVVTPQTSALFILAASSESPLSGKAIGIYWSSNEGNFELQNGQVFTQEDDNIDLTGAYAESSDDDLELDEILSIRLEITKIDKTNKLISGKFSFVVRYRYTNGSLKTFNITDGVFTDLEYNNDDN